MNRTTLVRLGPLVLIASATLTAGTANGAMAFALPWVALQRTGSAVDASIVAAGVALPLMVSTVFSGTVVDRVGRRTAAVGAEVFSAAAMLVLPVVLSTSVGSLPILVALTVLGVVFDQTGVVARVASLPAVAARCRLRLELVNGVHQGVWGLALLAGPGLAGVLLAKFGAVTTLTVVGAAFLLSALCGLTVPATTAEEAGRTRQGFYIETREGMRFAWRTGLLRALLLITVPMAAVYVPIEGLLLPVHFQALDAPDQLGVLLMATSAGAIAGSVGYGMGGHRLRRRTVFRACLVAIAACALVMSVLPTYAVMVLAAGLLGAAYGPINPLVSIAIQAGAPEAMRGRVVGVLTATGYAAGPVGLLAVGPAVMAFGVRAVFVVLAALLAVIAAASTFLRGLQDFDRLVTPGRSPRLDDAPQETVGAARQRAGEGLA